MTVAPLTLPPSDGDDRTVISGFCARRRTVIRAPATACASCAAAAPGAAIETTIAAAARAFIASVPLPRVGRVHRTWHAIGAVVFGVRSDGFVAHKTFERLMAQDS